jgi:hypothetical protein
MIQRQAIANRSFEILAGSNAKGGVAELARASEDQPMSNVCFPLSSYFTSLGSAKSSGSRSDVTVTPLVLLPATAQQVVSTVTVASKQYRQEMVHGTAPAQRIACQS